MVSLRVVMVKRGGTASLSKICAESSVLRMTGVGGLEYSVIGRANKDFEFLDEGSTC
jgi:hypothetical protein